MTATSLNLPAQLAWIAQPIAKTSVAWNVILPEAMDRSDAEVIAAVLRGEVDRYAELVDRYQGQAFRVALSVLGDYEDAKDVSQEAFVNAYRSLRRFRGAAKFSTWLYRIVVNECADAVRRRARTPVASVVIGDADPEDPHTAWCIDVDDPGAGPDDQLANQELGRQLRQAIGALPMRQKTAFALHHVHGLSIAEVAHVMGCRAGTVKAHIFRATASLRKQLTPWLNEEAA